MGDENLDRKYLELRIVNHLFDSSAYVGNN